MKSDNRAPGEVASMAEPDSVFLLGKFAPPNSGAVSCSSSFWPRTFREKILFGGEGTLAQSTWRAFGS
jgi:hypothetical protein